MSTSASALSDWLCALFSTSPTRSRLRGFSILLAASFFWLMAALAAHPPADFPVFLRLLVLSLAQFFTGADPGSSLPPLSETLQMLAGSASSLAWEILRDLFAPDILRHGLVIAFPFFLAYRIAAAYLDDVFDLQDQPSARRFIRRAAFGAAAPDLAVSQGALSPGAGEPVLASIGGPGLVQVDLENLAVSESIDGAPHLLTPGRRHALAAFARLRDVVDLRDQMTRTNELTVAGRTRDGVRIAARDVRLVYSVLRRPIAEEDGSDGSAYTYQEPAVLDLVYNRVAGPWTETMHDLVREHLARFISSHRLSEVLTAVGAPEARPRQTADLALPLAPVDDLGRTLTDRLPPDEKTGAVPRLILTELFFNPTGAFAVRAARAGLQLHWIDVGTWALPNQIVAETQLQAWKLSTENELRRRDLDRRIQESRREELLRLVREISHSGAPQPPTPSDVLFAYLAILRSARDSYAREGSEIPPQLTSALHLLTRQAQSSLDRSGRARTI